MSSTSQVELPEVDLPEVDVLVVTYNTRDLSVRALRRLLDETEGVRLRLLVRDNGSTDGTPSALRAQVPEAELDADERNLGFAAGVNRLVGSVHAPWAMLLNSDAWPEPGAVAALRTAGEARPDVAAVVPTLLRPDGTREHSPLPFPSVRTAILSGLVPRRVLRTATRAPLAGGVLPAGPVDWGVGAAVLVRTAALAAIGPLDERFFFYGEDLEWCWRAHSRGWQVWFEPAATVRHVGGASTTFSSAERSARVWGATYSFVRRCYPRRRAVAIRAVNVVASALQLLRARRNADLAAYWRGELRAHLRRAAA